MNSPAESPSPSVKSDDKLWAVISHLSLFVGAGILIPLIIYLVKKDDSPMVRHHSAEALNFHICVYIYIVLCVPLLLILVGIPLLIVLSLGSWILAILAAVRAADCRDYRYPLTIRFIS